MAIKPMADKAAYEQILWFLESQPKGRILDAPCGQGVLSQCLEEAGHEVFCCDLDPGQMQIREIPFKIANLNEHLPYTDSSFDYIASVAGIQRVYHPDHTIGEFHRLLKDGGYLLLSFPNYANIKSRWRFLLYGSIGKRIDWPRYDATISDAAVNFRQFILYPRLHHICRQAGFHVEQLRPGSRVRNLWRYGPVWGWVKLANLLSSRKREKDPQRYPGEMAGASVLGTDSLLLICRKKQVGGGPG